MLGPPGSGKTTFLGALNVALRDRGREQQDRPLAGRPGGPVRLMIEADGAPSASVELVPAYPAQEPIQFDLDRPESRRAEIARRARPGEVARTSTEITLRLADPAGELWSGELSAGRDPQHRREMVREIAGTDAILYLFDPIREFDTGDTLPSISRLIAQIKQEVASSKRPGFDGALPHRVAVCVTKFDHPRVLTTVLRTGMVRTDPGDPDGRPLVSDRDARQVFAGLCNGDGQALLDTIDGAFHQDRVRYFVTSATGFSRAGPARPVNVIEPVLWLTEELAAA